MLTNGLRRTLLVLSLIAVIFVGAGMILGRVDDQDKLYKKFDIFVEVMNRIRSDYVENVQTSSIFDGALKGMARILDSESSYLTAEEYKHFLEQDRIRSARTGITAIKHPGNGYAMVVSLQPESPAASSGIQKGDFVRAVDGISTRELPLIMIDLLLRGEPGTIAKMSVLRANVQGLLTFEIPRAELGDESAQTRTFAEARYLRLPHFDDAAIAVLKTEAERAAAAPHGTLVLDLRGNAGSTPEEAARAADLFIGGGSMFSLKTKEKSQDFSADDAKIPVFLIVLVDETTVRGAEAFALAIKTTTAGTLVGRNTLGFGSRQKDIILDDGAFLRISYAIVVAPDGAELQGKGVEPDIAVDRTAEDGDNDVILQTALDRARERTNKAA